MTQGNPILQGSYDPYLVGLSVFIAIFASYTALDLAGRVSAARGHARIGWLVGGAFGMGTGIWAMHFIGMLAFALPIPVSYEVGTVVASYLPAVVASSIALYIVSRPSLGVVTFAAGGIFMGLGICAMHYTGMAAMRLQATINYDVLLVSLSILIAMGASFLGLWLAFHLRDYADLTGILKKIGGALVMGSAIPCMHYTGMAAASFTKTGFPVESSSLVMDISVLGGTAIVAATFLLLGFALVSSFVDRRLTAKTAEIERSNELLRSEISERVKVEKALRESQAIFQLLQENLNEVVYILDKDARHVFISPSYERLTGRDSRKLLDDPMEWLNSIHPDDRERVRQNWEANIFSGNYVEELRAITPQGEVRWFLDRCVPVKDDSGQMTNLVGIVEDITTLKHREQALREAEEKYRSIYENASEGIFQTTPEGRYLSVNPSLARMYGYDTPDELMAGVTDVGAQIYVDPNRRETFKRILREKGTLQGFESQARKKDGSIIWISENARAVRDGSDQVAYYEGMVQDITARKQGEEAMREAMALTQKANERMRRDLQAAARVQKAFLPEAFPSFDHASAAWVYRPCAELGGDSLNVFQLGDSLIGMYVLDVSGHGVPASLLSVALSRVLTPRRDVACIFTSAGTSKGTRTVVSPAEVASRLNHMFLTDSDAKQFFTLTYGVLDTKRHQFRYVCAGHPAPIHTSRSHSPVLHEARNIPIGMFEEEAYEESVIDLEPGDRLYLYSDGVLEAMNKEREIFDARGLVTAIDGGRAKTLNESVDSLLRAVFAWTGDQHLHDDLSILGIELKDGR